MDLRLPVRRHEKKVFKAHMFSHEVEAEVLVFTRCVTPLRVYEMRVTTDVAHAYLDHRSFFNNRRPQVAPATLMSYSVL